MNTQKVFAKMLKAKASGKDVTVVADYPNAKEILKYILIMPDTYINDIEIASPDWKGYGEPYIINLGTDNGVYCQPAIYEDGSIARGSGLYYIDIVAIGTYLPEDFVLEGESQIKLVGGDD